MRKRWLVPTAVSLLLGAAPAFCGLWPDLSEPAARVGGGGKDAAVIVGIENYLAVEGVPGARSNAEAWQAYLTETRGVPPQRVALLRDGEGTLETIERYAAQKAAEVKPGGTLWFVFIGHGAPSKDGKDGLLVGADAQQRADSLYARSLSRARLLRVLAKGKQARTVVVLDACFSGRTSSGDELIAGLQPLVVTSAPGVLDPRTVLLTAARSDQFAGPLPKASPPRPAFSYLVLGGLRGWAADASGRVTAAGLLAFARKALSLARDRVQTPELTAASPAVVLSRGREPAPDLARIDRSEQSEGFRISALEPISSQQRPSAWEDKASGLDLSRVDVDALVKYDAAVKLDKSGAAPADKAASWRALAKAAPKFAALADKRAREWEQYAAQEEARRRDAAMRGEARDRDWAKLSRLLSLSVVPESDKTRWSEAFAQAYAETPGVAPEVAKALLAHAKSKAARAALEKAAKGAGAAAAAVAGKAGVEWVPISGGTFTMGSDSEEYDARPAHRVAVKSFELAKTPVTNRQYQECVAAGACRPLSSLCETAQFAGPDQPAVCVPWAEAVAFSKWVGGRLPTEAEWEYAARGSSDREYAWGAQSPSCERAVFYDSAAGRGCGHEATRPVCSTPAGNTPEGLCDMSGNAWQWVEDLYHGSYKGAPADGSAWEDFGWRRVARGGAWDESPDNLRATTRQFFDESDPVTLSRVGFRPARD